jgi:hypothetical protein
MQRDMSYEAVCNACCLLLRLPGRTLLEQVLTRIGGGGADSQRHVTVDTGSGDGADADAGAVAGARAGGAGECV